MALLGEKIFPNMQKILLLLSIVCILSIINILDVHSQDIIVTNDDSNNVENKGAIEVESIEELRKIIYEKPSVFVLFYALWCSHCQRILPEFDAAADMTRHHDPPVVLVKVNCPHLHDVVQEYDIREYPTLKLFLGREPHPYKNPGESNEVSSRQRNALVHWLNSRLDMQKYMNSTAHVDTIMKNYEEGHNVVFALLPKHFEKNTKYSHVANLVGDFAFFGASVDEGINMYVIEKYIKPIMSKNNQGKDVQVPSVPFVCMIDHHEGAVEFYTGIPSRGDADFADFSLMSFIKKHQFPTVISFSMAWAARILTDGRALCVLVVDKEHTDDSVLEAYRRVATAHRGSLLFALSGTSSTDDKRLMSLLGLEEDQVPAVRIVQSNPDNQHHHYTTKKYKPDGNMDGAFDENRMMEFVEKFLRNEAVEYLNSEPVPEVDEGPVKIVVGSTFDEIVMQTDKHVLIQFYAPWCGHCRSLEPKFKELAYRMRPVKDLIIARIDSTRNEVKGIRIDGYPTLLLFTGTGEERNIPKKFGNEERSVLNLMMFIQKHTNLKFNVSRLMQMDLETFKKVKDKKTDVGGSLEEL